MSTVSALSQTRPLWLNFVTLALPVAVQMLLQSLLGVADITMIGHLGETSIAAVGLATKLHFILLVGMIGLATACSVLIAQSIGAGKTDQAQKILVISQFTGAFLMLPFFIGFAYFSETWIAWINPDNEVGLLAARYLEITAPVLLITQAMIIIEASLRATGNSTTPLVIAIIGVISNIALNYGLIFGHWGFPKLGTEGAAIATLIARSVQLTLLVLWLYYKRHIFAVTAQTVTAAYDRPLIKRFIIFAIPLLINHLAWGLGNSTYHILSGFAGTNTLTVMGVLAPLEMCFLALFSGIASASGVLIGQALGADSPQYAWKLAKQFERLTLISAIIICVGLWLFKDTFIGIFESFDNQTAQLTSNAVTIFCLCAWLKAMNMYRIVGVLRAGGDNTYCLIWDLSVMWMVGLPLYAFAIWTGRVPFELLIALLFLEETLKYWPMRQRIFKKYWMKNLANH